MKKAGVKLLNCSKVTGFENGRVNIAHITKNVPDPYNTWQPILPKNVENPFAKKLGNETESLAVDADIVVLALGGRPDDKLFFEAQKARVAPELYNIGDSFAAGRVLEANRAAYALAERI